MKQKYKTGLAFAVLALFAILTVHQLQGTWTVVIEPKLNFTGIHKVHKPDGGKNVILSREHLRSVSIRIIGQNGTLVLQSELNFRNGAPAISSLPTHSFVEGAYEVKGQGTFQLKTGAQVMLPLTGKAFVGSDPIVSIELE